MRQSRWNGCQKCSALNKNQPRSLHRHHQRTTPTTTARGPTANETPPPLTPERRLCHHAPGRIHRHHHHPHGLTRSLYQPPTYTAGRPLPLPYQPHLYRRQPAAPATSTACAPVLIHPPGCHSSSSFPIVRLPHIRCPNARRVAVPFCPIPSPNPRQPSVPYPHHLPSPTSLRSRHPLPQSVQFIASLQPSAASLIPNAGPAHSPTSHQPDNTTIPLRNPPPITTAALPSTPFPFPCLYASPYP